MADLSLFPACALPGCSGLTDTPGTPCPGCVAAFGPMLRAGQPLPDRVITERDTAVAAAYAARRHAPPAPAAGAMNQPPPRPLGSTAAQPAPRRNQRCWCCDGRRTCRPDPGYRDGRWICPGCESL